MLRIEQAGDSYKYDIQGDDKQLLSELIELGGLVLACLTQSGEHAQRTKATQELALLRMTDSIAADMMKVAGMVIDEGGLPRLDAKEAPGDAEPIERAEESPEEEGGGQAPRA